MYALSASETSLENVVWLSIALCLAFFTSCSSKFMVTFVFPIITYIRSVVYKANRKLYKGVRTIYIQETVNTVNW